MSAKIAIPKFQLQTVYVDGSADEPTLHALNGIDAECRMGRRGFLLTSAVGAGALAALTVGCDSSPKKKSPPPAAKKSEPAVEKPSLPQFHPERVIGVVAHQSGARTVAFSPDGTLLASGGNDKTIRLWSMPDCKLRQVLKAHTGRVIAVMFSPDGKLLTSVAEGGTIRFWSEPGKGPKKFWSPSGWAVRKTLDNVKGFYSSRFTLSPEGTLLANAGPTDLLLQLFSLPAGTIQGTLQHHEPLTACAFSPDGKLLASGAGRASDQITLWDVPSLQKRKEWSAKSRLLAFSADGSVLLSADTSTGGLSFWSMPSAEYQRKILVSHQSNLRAIAFSPDGKWLAVGSGRTDILLLPKPFTEPAFVLKGDRVDRHGRASNITAVTFSKDGGFLAVALEGGGIDIWKMPEEGNDPVFHTALFDPEATSSGIAVRQHTRAEKTVHIISCGTPLPAGAVCTCNCVSGKYTPPRPVSSGGGSTGGGVRSGGGGGGCRCNRICTCIPVK